MSNTEQSNRSEDVEDKVEKLEFSDRPYLLVYNSNTMSVQDTNGIVIVVQCLFNLVLFLWNKINMVRIAIAFCKSSS
jgi:hypothetical protein